MSFLIQAALRFAAFTESIPQQLDPRTLQSTFQPKDCRQQKVYFAGFDFLKASQMQICHFCKLLLSELLCEALTPHIRPKPLDIGPIFG
jgi:hypothetical protein